MIQSMGGDNLSEAYDTVIKVENCLIQAGKLSPRPPMLLFLEAPTQHPVLAPIPVASTSHLLKLTLIPPPSKFQDLKTLMKGLSNELVTLKRKQIQNNKPYKQKNQNYQHQRSNFQGQNQWSNARPLNSLNPSAKSTSKAIVPIQNNLLRNKIGVSHAIIQIIKLHDRMVSYLKP